MESGHNLPIPQQTLQAIQENHPLVFLENMAATLRIHSLRSTAAAGSGHPTSCSSIAELFAVLFFDKSGLRYSPEHPADFNNDKLVLSKGHAAPILYAAWAEAGYFPTAQLVNLRKFGNNLEGHPTPKLAFVDVATGSLGQGISVACGLAYSMKVYEESNRRVYAVLGDGQCAEGSVWEAFNFASFYGLDNLVAVIDVNRMGQSNYTMFQQNLEQYERRIAAFGWNTVVIDGHSIPQIINGLDKAALHKGAPTAIIAKTYKGRDFGDNIEDKLNWHGKPMPNTDEIIQNLQSKIKETPEKHTPNLPVVQSEPRQVAPVVNLPAPEYQLNALIATRNAYGDALAALARVDWRVIALDGDTSNSTMSNSLNSTPQYIECFIGEQNMAGVALGLSKRGWIPFASTFAAFLSRAADHIRMCGLSFGNVKFVGSHCGCSIGEDGGSQMALEDISAFRAVIDSAVLYPSDAVSSYRAVEIAMNFEGPVYIRNSRPTTPVIYENNQRFELGKSIVVKQSENDRVMVVSGGVTLHEAIKAYDLLKTEGIPIKVVDIFSIKPLDRELLEREGLLCAGGIIVVEDHYEQGGIYEAVCGALVNSGIKLHSLSVKKFPRSGKPGELLDYFGLSADKIVGKVKEVLG